MGLKDRWSSGIGLDDVVMNLVAFEAMNNVRLQLCLSVVDRNGRADMHVTALAFDRTLSNADRPPLVSVNVSCLASRLKALDAALIHALYLLDGQLAKREFAEVKTE